MAIIKLTFKKIDFSSDPASCWFCGNPTHHALVEISGSEIWCCERCAKKKRKVRKHSRLQPEVYSYKKIQITKEKTPKNASLGEELNPPLPFVQTNLLEVEK